MVEIAFGEALELVEALELASAEVLELAVVEALVLDGLLEWGPAEVSE
jgi:hypothetical protein